MNTINQHPTTAIKIKIDEAIPLPDRRLYYNNTDRCVKRREYKYPFSRLSKPGASFFYPKVTIERISSAKWQAEKRLGCKFKCFTTREKHENYPRGVLGVRVWRVRNETTGKNSKKIIEEVTQIM